MSKRKRVFIIFAALLLLLTACSSGGQVMDGEDMVRSYTQISQDEAKQMMQQDDGHVIVDVRRPDEFAAGHIPGAICIPNETIGSDHPEELPDLAQVILVYCRSGNRSKQAAQKLFDMGYTNVYEFGGIIDWTGEVVTETQDADSSQESESETQDTDSPQESEPEAQMTDEEKTDMKLKMKCVIDRFYAAAYPNKPAKLKKVAMFLSSGDPDMYDGALFSYQGDFLDYLQLEGMGVFTTNGYDPGVSEAKLEELRAFGASL